MIARVVLTNESFPTTHPYVKGIVTIATPHHGLKICIPLLLPLVARIVAKVIDPSVGELYEGSEFIEWLEARQLPNLPWWTVAGTKPTAGHVLSSLLVENPDDGYVHAGSASLDGAVNLRVPASHVTILAHEGVVELVNGLAGEVPPPGE